MLKLFDKTFKVQATLIFSNINKFTIVLEGAMILIIIFVMNMVVYVCCMCKYILLRCDYIYASAHAFNSL